MKAKMICLLATAGLLLAACGASGSDQGGGFGEAIAVHGNWTIDVLNPDGTLDEHHNFQNAFTGAFALAPVLAMNKVVDGWGVLIVGDTDLCDDLFTDCRLNSDVASDEALLSVTEDGATNEVVLTGTVVVDVGGNIVGVEGLLGVCNPGTNCSIFRGFSDKTLDSPIAVTAGQAVQVEVRYSFG